MFDLDGRLILLALWGGGVIAVYGQVLAKRLRAYRYRRDARSLRELLAGLALFLTATCAALAVWSVLFAEGDGLRELSTAMALGAMLGAGIVMAGERAHPDGKQ